MNSAISRHFVTVSGRQIHYRRAGQGTPVVMLHQSPTSSRDMEPLMRTLAVRHSVFAPDMPGYGGSDPLPEPQLTIERLADNTAAFMDAVGIDRAGVYGFHTGASIATAFARRHAARVSVSVAVGLLCPTPPERAELLQHYLPPFVPRWDGSHLAWLWSRIKDQSIFFPWYRRTGDARVSMDGRPPDAVHAGALDWLRCGARYRDAYEAAFHYRPDIDLAHIGTPLFIVSFPADPLFEHLDRLPAARSCVSIVPCATAAEAEAAICGLFDRFGAGGTAPNASSCRPVAGRCWRDYVTVEGIQLRVLRAGDPATRPVLVQHGAQGAVTACSDLIDALGESRSAVALELPGHGDSDPLPEAAVSSVDELARLLFGSAKALGISDVDLIGLGAGAAIHAAFAARGGVTVRSLSLIGAIDVSRQPVLQRRMLDSYSDAPLPDFYGGHLLRDWHAARDHLLFFPWYERSRDCAVIGDPQLDPGAVHRRAVDSILAGAAGWSIRRSEVLYPLLERLAAVRCPLEFAAPRWHPRFAHAGNIATAAGCKLIELPRDSRDWNGSLMASSDI